MLHTATATISMNAIGFQFRLSNARAIIRARLFWFSTPIVGANIAVRLSTTKSAIEFKDWEQRDPIRRYRERIGATLDAKMENAISADIMAEIEDARAFARVTPLPDPSQATRHVYA
jgi:hypothetical protein